jgi:hypothetical protein
VMRYGTSSMVVGKSEIRRRMVDSLVRQSLSAVTNA